MPLLTHLTGSKFLCVLTVSLYIIISTILFILNLLSSRFSDPPTTFNHSVPVLQHLAASLYFLQRLTTSYHFVPLHPASYHILLSFTSCYFSYHPSPPLFVSYYLVLPLSTSNNFSLCLQVLDIYCNLVVASHHLLPPLVTWSYFSLLPTMSCTHLPLLTQLLPILTTSHLSTPTLATYHQLWSHFLTSHRFPASDHCFSVLPLLTIIDNILLRDRFLTSSLHVVCHICPLLVTSLHFMSPPATTSHLSPCLTTSDHFFPCLSTSYHFLSVPSTSYHFLPRLNTSFQSSQRPTTSHHACPLRPTPSHLSPLLATARYLLPHRINSQHILLRFTTAHNCVSYHCFQFLSSSHHLSPRLINTEGSVPFDGPHNFETLLTNSCHNLSFHIKSFPTIS